MSEENEKMGMEKDCPIKNPEIVEVSDGKTTKHEIKQVANHETTIIKRYCDQFGYGRVMQIASQEWLKKHGDGCVTGPYKSLVVKCVCCDDTSKFRPGRCDYCCGCGWLTEDTYKIVKKHLEAQENQDE